MTDSTRKWTIGIAVTVLVILGGAWLVLRSTTRDKAVGETRMRVLAILPMTGPGASLGEFLSNGLELGKHDAEQRFAGRLRIELQIVDSKNQPREGVSALQQELALHRPDAIICAMSSVSSAVVPIVEEQGVTTIVTTTALEGLPQGTARVVRVYPTSEDFVAPVAAEMAKRHKRVAILYVHDDFGDSNQRIMTALLRDAGVSVTNAEPYELMEKDFRPLLGKVLGSSPEAVFVTGYGPAFISIIRQLRERHRELPIYTEIGFANPAVLAALGDNAEGIIFDGTDVELDEPETDAARAFAARYAERFGGRPYQVAGFARDAMVMLAEAAMTNDVFQPPTKPGLVALSPFQGVMGEIHLDAEGESRVRLELMERVGGVNRRLQRAGP